MLALNNCTDCRVDQYVIHVNTFYLYIGDPCTGIYSVYQRTISFSIRRPASNSIVICKLTLPIWILVPHHDVIMTSASDNLVVFAVRPGGPVVAAESPISRRWATNEPPMQAKRESMDPGMRP
jgi:hypothetical protein